MPKFGELRFNPKDKYEQQSWDGTKWISASEFRKKYLEKFTTTSPTSDNSSITTSTFGVTRFDPNDKFEQQAWDGTNWISTSDFRKKYGTKNTQSPSTNVNIATNSTPITDKQYQRDINFGDFSLTGQSSNGINVTKDGNIFQFTGTSSPFLDNLRQNQYNGPLRPDDPNNNASFIGMFVAGTTDIKLGNPTQQTLNKNIDTPKDVVTPDKKTTNPGRSIIIGDSQTPLIQKNSKKLEPVSTEGKLWKVGWSLNKLNRAIQDLKPDEGQNGVFITNVFICIGTNDGYSQYKVEEGTSKGKKLIPIFIENVKKAFPKAKLYVIKGSKGWGNLASIQDIDTKIDKYYSEFSKEGVTVLNNGIGTSTSHPDQKTPGIIEVAKEIDSIIGGSSLPSTESTPQPKKVIKKAEDIPNIITTDTDDLMTEEYDSLPNEEGTQIFKIIRVDQNIQDNVPDKSSPSLIGSDKNIKQIESNNGGSIPKDGADFTKYGSQFALVKNDGTLGNQYYYPCALFNQGDPQWGSLYGGGYTLKAAGCCYCSLCMIATYHKNNAAYTPKWFWDNAKKSTVVYWDVMGNAVKLNGSIINTRSMSTVDKQLSSRPVMFEWDNTNKASKTKYSRRYTKRHHWMVINGRNTDGTYTIFDPNGGKIWKNQTKEAIEAGLIRIFHF